MKLVKKVDGFSIYQRRDERYAVADKAGKAVNGEEKIKLLLAEGLIKLSEAAPAEAPAEDAAEETAAEGEAEEAPAE